MFRSSLTRATRMLAVAGAVVLALAACQAGPRTAPAPIASAMLVRNTSPFDINVYALTDDGDRQWLTTVPAKQQRTLTIEPRMLRTGKALVVQAQSIGSSSKWTSNSLIVDLSVVAVLDLTANSSGDSSASLFYTVDAAELQASWR